MADPILDLNFRQWTDRRRGLVAIGTWVYVVDEDEFGRWRPCMVIVREKMPDGAKPCCVLLDNAWWWSDQIGSPARVANVVTAFLDKLGLDPFEADDHAAVIDVVLHNLQALICMPPAPAELVANSEKVAEIRIRDHQTGRTTEAEV